MAHTARVCIKAARLADPYARIPHELLDRLFCELPLRLGDDAFGRHAAELGASATHDVFDAEMSAFFRAFRCWTGQTPGEFRSRSLDPASG